MIAQSFRSSASAEPRRSPANAPQGAGEAQRRVGQHPTPRTLHPTPAFPCSRFERHYAPVAGRTAHTEGDVGYKLISQMSRRRFVGWFLALVLPPGRINSRAMPTSLLQRTPDASTQGFTLRPRSQRYRADAVILLFGIVI